MAEKKIDIRSTQTKTKHKILTDYLDAWAGIIFFGIKAAYKRNAGRYTPHFVYVDCFSFKGKYDDGDLDDPTPQTVYGSPIVGIKALDKLARFSAEQGLPVSTNVILIEKKKQNYEVLQETLREMGYESRVEETINYATLKNGDIAIANMDAIVLGDDLVAYTNVPYTWAFYLIDPWGASGIPYDFVQKIVSVPRHDVMINFIYEDFLRKTGMAFGDLEPRHRYLVDLWRNAFGDEVWQDVVLPTLRMVESKRNFRDALDNVPMAEVEREFLSDEKLSVVKERLFASGYARTLQNMDSDIATKLIALRFPDKERTMLYLFLTTHDPTGALKMNDVLYKAKLLEFEIRHRARMAKRVRAEGQPMLWDLSTGIPDGQKDTPRPESQEIAKDIFGRFKGQRTNRKEIYGAFVDTDLFPREIDKALGLLKRQGLVQFDGNRLTHRIPIIFKEK